mgnify:CR=1 FL=1
MITRAGHRDEVHFLSAGDGVALTLIRVHGRAEPTKGPVMLVHGVAMRAEAFRPPGIRSLVDVLLDEGWDVWLLNWRGSIDLDPLPWVLDRVARHDLPAAVAEIRRSSGAPTVKVIAHCAGAGASSMAAVAGLLPEVDLIIANGLSLHVALPGFSRFKLRTVRPVLQRFEPFVDAGWGDGPENLVPWLTRSAVRLWHTECRNPTCNMACFAIGSGSHALWMHANLAESTHDWLRHEFGKIPMSLYHQLAVSAKAGQLVSVTEEEGLPSRFADAPPKTDARFVLLAGDQNRTFLPAGQRATHDWLNRARPGSSTLHVIPGYSHGDIFIGRRAHRDVFPLILEELNPS